MKILQVLTYYRPHISGLTIYVERLSRALVKQGHDVTVFTSQYDSTLPQNEIKDGVNIVRVPVAFRISKGVIMPGFGPMAWKMVRNADIVHLHLPQFDAPGVALRGRMFHKPVILTYHSDLQLPPGVANRFIDSVVHGMNRIAGELSDAVVAYTNDFARHSPFLSRYLDKKLHVIPPPVILVQSSDAEVKLMRERLKLNDKKVIGISARLAAEKGIEVLLKALPLVMEKLPETIVLHASPDAIGEEEYVARIMPMIEAFGSEHYRLLGPLVGADLTAFYRNLDCLVMCSLNNTETFGLVQIEAMMNGVPVVASDLPGVRQPVRMTGMGEIVPIGDPESLAVAILKLLNNKESYIRSASAIAQSFEPGQTAEAYVRLYEDLQAGKKKVVHSVEPAAYGNLRAMRDGARS